MIKLAKLYTVRTLCLHYLKVNDVYEINIAYLMADVDLSLMRLVNQAFGTLVQTDIVVVKL